MSGRLAALRRGAPATFVAHVVVTALAAVVAWPLAGVLSRGGLTDASDLAATVDAAWSAAPGVAAVASTLLVVLALAALVAPLVEVAWLASLATRHALADSFALAIRRYGAAWRVRLLLAPLAAVALVLLFAVPGLLSSATSGLANERTADLVALSGILPALLLFVILFAWHDLAMAALATTTKTAVGALLRSARHAVSPRALAVYALVTLASLLLTYLGHALATWLGHDTAPALVALVATQALALLRTFCRAWWLADAVTRVTA